MHEFKSIPDCLDCCILTSGQFTYGSGRITESVLTAQRLPNLLTVLFVRQILVAEMGRFHQKTTQSPEANFFISDCVRQYWHQHRFEGHLQG